MQFNLGNLRTMENKKYFWFLIFFGKKGFGAKNQGYYKKMSVLVQDCDFNKCNAVIVTQTKM